MLSLRNIFMQKWHHITCIKNIHKFKKPLVKWVSVWIPVATHIPPFITHRDCLLPFHLEPAVGVGLHNKSAQHINTHGECSCCNVPLLKQGCSPTDTWMIDSIISWYVSITYWGWDKMAVTSQTTFSNAFSWMKLYEFLLKFHWSLFLRVQITIFHHWFR